MDLKSIMGYAVGSPYNNAPYLDIKTPEGLIDMANTNVDLLGIDNLGNAKKMKAGRKNPYKFEGDMVREIPLKSGGYTEAQYLVLRGLKDAHNHGDFDNMSPNKARKILHAKKLFGKPLTPEQYRLFGYLSEGNTLKYKQEGGNPYQQGGLTTSQAFNFLFEGDDDEEETKSNVPTAPSTEEVQPEESSRDNSDYDAAMQIANQGFGNPYRMRQQREQDDNTFMQILSSGAQGNQNVGQYGRQIYGQLANDLGYAPVANSIYRTQAQQNELVAKGIGVKNSYHLTGDAIDLKPQDWHKLSNEQQQYYRMNYDVVYHNNHYHIEPSNKNK